MSCLGRLRWLMFLLFIAFVVLAIVLAIAGERAQDEAIATGSWGLSFPTPGQAPQSSLSDEKLREYDATCLGDTSEKVIYLTFDAGYENGYTAQILDVLQAHDVKAAFFLVGNYIEQNPELVKRMVAEGHIVGNHTYHHPNMSKIATVDAFREELETLEALYAEVVGQEMPKFYRPPQGVYSEENLKMAKDLGYKTVFWSLAYVDWLNDDQPTSEEAFSKLIPRAHNGAVVLLHSTSKTNAAILDELLRRWKELGYEFSTIDLLF